jgi:hypothetical protein
MPLDPDSLRAALAALKRERIERDQIAVRDNTGSMGAPGNAAGRPRQHRARRQPPGFADWRHPAMRLHDQDRTAIARLGKAPVEQHQIACQRGSDIGVDDRRRDPLEPLDLRQHLGRQRHLGAGKLGLDCRTARFFGDDDGSVAPGRGSRRHTAWVARHLRARLIG